MHPSTLQVLIVDDSPEDRVTLRRFLSRVAPDSYTVLEADRGDRALAVCRAAPPDCVLLDYRLPDRDGLAVLAALRAFTDVPVVLLTGVGHEALAVEAFRRGVQDYLIKDSWAPEQLHLSIQRAVATVKVVRERDYALARLDALVTEAPSGIAYLDRELRYVLINPTLAALNGQPPEAHLGRTLAEMLPTLAPQLEPLVRQVLATGEAVRDVELRGELGPHGEEASDWLLSFYPVRGPLGESAGVGVTVMDISQTKRTEAALRASEARYRAMFEQNAAIQLLIDPQSGAIVDANPAAVGFYGYPRETLLSMEISAINQLTPEQVRAEMEAARRELQNNFHVPHRLASGDVRTVEVFTSPIEVGGRQLLYSIIHDETERVRAEQALRASEAKLRAVFNALVEGVVVLSPQGEVEEANDAVQRLHGHTLKELANPATDPRGRIIYPDGSPFPEDAQPAIVALRTGQMVRDVEMGVPAADGTLRWRLVNAQPVTDTDGTLLGAVASFFDITERKRAEQALETERALLARRVAERTADLSLANAELARAARLKDEFLASMSHELRTPLTGILGRAEALEEAVYGPVTPEQVTAFHSIAESGQHLLTLINDILDLSKIEAGRLTLERATLDVDLLGTVSIRMVAQIAQVKRIALSSKFDGQVQRVEADERRLKQILVNLLSNAVKFTPEGGKVGLEVQGDPEQQTVTFTVWDTGIGIAAEDLPRLFQPFVQLDTSLNRQYTGTGLGLSLVAQLAQAHGGSVAVESTPGQGSRFSVTLPWSPTALGARLAPATVAIDTMRPAVRRALVVEDSPTVAAQITRYLRELGARVEIQPHGTGTVERAIALQPDVIILDILLPDDDGWAVLRELKAELRTRDIPVLVISVVDEPERVQTLGAAAMLVKPIDRPMLEQALRQILGHPAAPPAPTALLVAPHLGRPRILLADDNEETLDTLGDYLRAKGYELRVARNGSEALLQAQEERPDVILMDIQMPGMDGLEAIRRIRAEPTLAHVPILAVTALAMPGDRERCLAAGADAYLAKPLNLRTLAAAIEAHRQQRTGSPRADQLASEGADPS